MKILLSFHLTLVCAISIQHFLSIFVLCRVQQMFSMCVDERVFEHNFFCNQKKFSFFNFYDESYSNIYERFLNIFFQSYPVGYQTIFYEYIDSKREHRRLKWSQTISLFETTTKEFPSCPRCCSVFGLPSVLENF